VKDRVFAISLIDYGDAEIGRRFGLHPLMLEGIFNTNQRPLRSHPRTPAPEPGQIRKPGADSLSYSPLDAIVDHYFNILENIGERTEELGDMTQRPAPLPAKHRRPRRRFQYVIAASSADEGGHCCRFLPRTVLVSDRKQAQGHAYNQDRRPGAA
jgi:hypothetical protein